MLDATAGENEMLRSNTQKYHECVLLQKRAIDKLNSKLSVLQNELASRSSDRRSGTSNVPLHETAARSTAGTDGNGDAGGDARGHAAELAGQGRPSDGEGVAVADVGGSADEH